MFKMLCSFGGKILPRPVDGAPRYAGGHTRIISVPRRSSFPEFYDKMAAVYGGSPVAIRYHVPDEELDVLISVSSSEDLENMMCEYDKLGDGSAGRLRVFLFSVVENEIYGYWMNDGGKKYVEAINGVVSGEKQEGIDSGDRFRASIDEASRDPSRVSFLGNVNSETECKKGFTTNSITNVSPISPLLSVGLLVSKCSSHNQGTVKRKAYVDENQDVERAPLHLTHNANYKDFSENVEHYGMPFLPPLIELQEFSLEDGQIVQKPLLHAHSDTFLMEQSNFAGVSSSESSGSTFPGHHSEDITALQSQHRENIVKPKLETTINLDQVDVSWMNRNSTEFSKRGNFDEPNANKFDHSKSKMSLNPTGLSGDTEQLHGTCTDLSQHFYKDIYLRLQREHREKNFNVDKYCRLPTTVDFSDGYHTFYEGPSTPPQPVYDNSWQQKMVDPAEMFNHASWPGIYSPPSHSMNTSGMFFNTSQLNHESSLQHPQQQQFQSGATPPFAFEIKEDAIQKQLGQVSSSMENREYHGQPSMNTSAQEKFHDYLHVEFDKRLHEKINPSVANHHIVSKDTIMEIASLIKAQNHGRRPQNGANLSIGRQLGQVSSSMENRQYQAQPPMNNFVQENFQDYVDGLKDFYLIDFEEMRLNEKINSAAANHIISKMEISSVVGEPNHATGPQNGANMFDEYKVLDRPGIVPECFSVRVINPLVSNTGCTMDLNPKISSVVGEGRCTMRPHNCADILPSRNAFFNSGKLPELATNVNFTPASMLNHHLLSQIFEGDVEPGITVCPTEYDYGIATNKSFNEELKDEANDTATPFQRGSVSYPYSNSNFIPWHMKQQCTTCSSDPLFCYQDPCGRCPQGPSILGDNESDVWEDTFYDEIFVQLKGASQPPVDSLNNSSPPSPLFKSLTKYSPASCSPASNESSSTFPNWIGSCEGMASSSSIVVPHADDIGRLQIIKNVDLQELHELGSGTFGTVFYGKWRGSEVAIKRINNRCFTRKPSEQELMRTNFWNEASKLSDLHHPNVLAFYGIVLDGPGGSFATVTEYMVNGSLRNALLCNQNTFDRRKRLLIATDVAFGMEYLHGKNIVHFDLKSDNLLVNLRDPQRPICKVGDFGLSKVKGKTIISGGGRGTLLWMAPELLNGSSNLVSEKVDVFSFGIIMWELLTGKEPYADLHFGAIIGGIVNNTLRPPVPEFCDPDWRELMEQCWSAKPSARPSFTQIARSLSFMVASLS